MAVQRWVLWVAAGGMVVPAAALGKGTAPDVAVDRGSVAVAWSDGSIARVAPGSATLEPDGRLPARGHGIEIEPDGSGGLVAAWIGPKGVTVAERRAEGGAWSRARVLSRTGWLPSEVRLARGPGGTTIAFWRLVRIRRHRVVESRLQASRRAPGADWGAALDVARIRGEFIGGPAVGIDRAGNALAAWTEPSRGGPEVRVASLPASASRWGSASRVGRSASLQSFALGVAPEGAAVLLWSAPELTYVARPDAAGPWTRGRVPVRSLAGGGTPALAFDSRSRVRAAWPTGGGGIETSAALGAAAWTPPKSLSTAGPGRTPGWAPSLVAAEGGAFVALWNSAPGPHQVGSVQAASWTRAGGWSRPIRISGDDSTFAATAVADGSGGVVALWDSLPRAAADGASTRLGGARWDSRRGWRPLARDESLGR